VRALAIAFFYALGTGVGGIGAPWLFGALIGTGEPSAVAWGYALCAVLMLIASAPLEEVARPLSLAAGDGERARRSDATRS
jgi:hypothetical protein